MLPDRRTDREVEWRSRAQRSRSAAARAALGGVCAGARGRCRDTPTRHLLSSPQGPGFPQRRLQGRRLPSRPVTPECLAPARACRWRTPSRPSLKSFAAPRAWDFRTCRRSVTAGKDIPGKDGGPEAKPEGSRPLQPHFLNAPAPARALEGGGPRGRDGAGAALQPGAVAAPDSTGPELAVPPPARPAAGRRRRALAHEGEAGARPGPPTASPGLRLVLRDPTLPLGASGNFFKDLLFRLEGGAWL